MSGIQLLLITGVLFIAVYFFTQLQKRLLHILLLVVLIAGAVLFILWPDGTTRIAQTLGVGRGADLIFYISILLFWFVSLKLFARIRRLEKELTQVVRNLALNNAMQIQHADKATTIKNEHGTL